MNPLHRLGLGLFYRELRFHVGKRDGFTTVHNPTLITPEQIETFPYGELAFDVLDVVRQLSMGGEAPYLHHYVEGHEEYILEQIGQEILIGGLMYYFKIPPSNYKLLFEAIDAYQEFR